MNDAALRDHILSGWRHREEAVHRYAAAASPAIEAAGTTHFVHFPSPSAARVAAARFDASGQVQLDESTSGEREPALVRVLTRDREDAEHRLLAEELGGEYDGTETAVG